MFVGGDGLVRLASDLLRVTHFQENFSLSISRLGVGSRDGLSFVGCPAKGVDGRLKGLSIGCGVTRVGRADLGLGDPEERLIGQARFFIGERLQNLRCLGELSKLDLAKSGPQLGISDERRARVLRGKSREMSQGFGESSTFILEYSQEESCLGDVRGRRIASQSFESSFFAEIILETIGLLEGFGSL